MTTSPLQSAVMLAPVIKVLFTALIVVAVLAVAVRALESRLAFFPSVGESVTPEDFGVPYEKTSLAAADGVNLRGWSMPHPSPRALIVVFPRKWRQPFVWAPILVGIHRQGYAVRAFDYRGYGASTGRPSERGLYRDVDAAVEWAWRAGGRSVPVVYWGRSLGTTMAAYAATRRSPDGLILEAGFPTRAPCSAVAAAGIPQPVLVVPVSDSRMAQRRAQPRPRHARRQRPRDSVRRGPRAVRQDHGAEAVRRDTGRRSQRRRAAGSQGVLGRGQRLRRVAGSNVARRQ